MGASLAEQASIAASVVEHAGGWCGAGPMRDTAQPAPPLSTRNAVPYPSTPESGLKYKMAKNSLFAILLRSPWWISLLIALLLAALSFALLPAQYSVAGAISGSPFVVIAVMAARRQWRLPGAARIARTRQALTTMSWPVFAALLEQAFLRDGYTTLQPKRPSTPASIDFVLERQGRRMLVCARRWKSARTGIDALRALQTAREIQAGTDDGDMPDALYIALEPLSDSARPFAAAHGIAIWQADELTHALRGLPLPPQQQQPTPR